MKYILKALTSDEAVLIYGFALCIAIGLFLGIYCNTWVLQ